MSVVCEKCGAISDKYNVLSYKISYLEEFLSDYYKMPIMDILGANLKTRKQLNAKEICHYILYKFSGYTMNDIQKKYMLPDNPSKSFSYLIKSKNQDFIYLTKLLSSEINALT